MNKLKITAKELRALGYPESYYTPPFEALKSIEIIRGSAALQFGTQFGGLLITDDRTGRSIG